jgi:hypothetical protein
MQQSITNLIADKKVSHLRNKLSRAINADNLDEVQALLSQVPAGKEAALILRAPKKEYTLLHWATASPLQNRLPLLQTLIAKVPPADLDMETVLRQLDREGQTLLHWIGACAGGAAYIYDRPEIMTFLLSKVPEANRAQLFRNNQVLERIVQYGHPSVLKAVLETIPAGERAALIMPLFPDTISASPIPAFGFYCKPIALAHTMLSVLTEAERLTIIQHTQSNGLTTFQDAVGRQKLPLVRVMLSAVSRNKYAELFQPTSPQERQPLFQDAVKQSDLLVSQAILSVASGDERTELIKGVLQGNHQNSQTVLQHTPVMMYILLSSLPKAQRDEVLNATNEQGQTLLQLIQPVAAQPLGAVAQPQVVHPRTLEMAALFLAYGADPNQLSAEFRTQVLDISHRQLHHHATQLTNLQPIPEQIRYSSKMLQWLIKSGDLTQEQVAPITRQFNVFLTKWLEQLNQNPTASKVEKIKLLGRCLPVLQSGIPVNGQLREQLLEKAQEIKYQDFLHKLVVVSPEFSTLQPFLRTTPEFERLEKQPIPSAEEVLEKYKQLKAQHKASGMAINERAAEAASTERKIALPTG